MRIKQFLRQLGELGLISREVGKPRPRVVVVNHCACGRVISMNKERCLDCECKRIVEGAKDVSEVSS